MDKNGILKILFRRSEGLLSEDVTVLSDRPEKDEILQDFAKKHGVKFRKDGKKFRLNVPKDKLGKVSATLSSLGFDVAIGDEKRLQRGLAGRL